MIEQFIRDVPDFPKEGIVFKDITPLLQDADGLSETIDLMAAVVDGGDFDLIAGVESRGFIFGTALAYKLEKGFIPIRKPKKLPWKTASEEYDLEYGKDTIEIHVDAVEGRRVLLVDDLLATGGTAEAALKLISKVGGTSVACAFWVDLPDLGGADRLRAMDIDVHILMAFEGE